MPVATIIRVEEMRKDDRIEGYVAAGKRNAEAMDLMRNWCAHARTRRLGGVGMIEEMSGFPIGHFSMECDHAPEGGMSAYYFGDAALVFLTGTARIVYCESRLDFPIFQNC